MCAGWEVGLQLAQLGVQTVRGLDLGQVISTLSLSPTVLRSHGLFSWQGDNENYDCPNITSCLNYHKVMRPILKNNNNIHV